MEELIGNVLVAQSGGPTAVINASLAGVITEALNHDCIEEIYGGLNGIEGILNEQIIDLAQESQQTVRGLRYTPGSALGTCRYKLKTEQDFAKLLEVFKKYNIRFFFYIGGNDSQDTTNKISQYADEKGYALRAIGVPKTVDNDLPMTDHCPGYGSVVKYLCASIRELALDHESMGNHDLVSIVEVMGRDAGWIAAGTTMAKRRGELQDPPHIILLPEVAFNPEYFIAQVQECLKVNKYCLVVASEGLADANGQLRCGGRSRPRLFRTRKARRRRQLPRRLGFQEPAGGQGALVEARTRPEGGGNVRIAYGLERGVHVRSGGGEGCGRRRIRRDGNSRARRHRKILLRNRAYGA